MGVNMIDKELLIKFINDQIEQASTYKNLNTVFATEDKIFRMLKLRISCGHFDISTPMKKTCGWKNLEETCFTGTYTGNTDCGKTRIIKALDYKYCPYCGLEIKEEVKK